MNSECFSFEGIAYGVGFRFTAESASLLAQMKACAPWGGRELEDRGNRDKPSASAEFALVRSGSRFQLKCDGVDAGDEAALAGVLEQLARETMVHVADHAPDRVFVHAGVVEWQGRALLLPGRSCAGKSTLVSALVKAGANYYSDEYGVIDAFGRVHPYARALQMREPGRSEQRPSAICGDENAECAAAIHVSHVVFTEYAAAGEWRPEIVSPGHAVLSMMEHAIPVQRAPARVMSALAKMMEGARAVRSVRGEAVPAAAILLEMMSAAKDG